MNGNGNPFVSNVGVLNEGLRPFSYWRLRAQRVLDAWQAGDRAAGTPTGLRALDNFIRLTPGELTILAARPGMGKSALALQIGTMMVPAGNAEERVAFFSAEMSGWSLNMRLATSMADVSMFALRSGRASADDFARVSQALEYLEDVPILVDDRSSPSISYMRDELSAMGASFTIRGMIFDFLELIGSEGTYGERQISEAAKQLKQIAKDFDIPVLAISHLNREVEDRKDKMPQLADLRFSGMIEQIADVVMFMVRPKYYLDKGMKIDLASYDTLQVDGDGGATNVEDPAYVVIAKNRNGRTGIARLAFDAPKMKFSDIERSYFTEPDYQPEGEEEA